MTEKIRNLEVKKFRSLEEAQEVWTDGFMTGDKVMRLSGYKLKNSSPYHPIT